MKTTNEILTNFMTIPSKHGTYEVLKTLGNYLISNRGTTNEDLLTVIKKSARLIKAHKFGSVWITENETDEHKFEVVCDLLKKATILAFIESLEQPIGFERLVDRLAAGDSSLKARGKNIYLLHELILEELIISEVVNSESNWLEGYEYLFVNNGTTAWQDFWTMVELVIYQLKEYAFRSFIIELHHHEFLHKLKQI